ncbi:MAG: DUF3833 family protein [Geminicoccales bacterium]
MSTVTPEFRLEQVFDGEVKVWGIVQDQSGNLVQRFEADRPLMADHPGAPLAMVVPRMRMLVAGMA